jgi:hypothetical protein
MLNTFIVRYVFRNSNSVYRCISNMIVDHVKCISHFNLNPVYLWISNMIVDNVKYISGAIHVPLIQMLYIDGFQT